MTLEQKIESLIDPAATYDVFAYELWGNRREGLEVNDLWRIARAVDLPAVLEAARGRWEVFKVNYAPRGRVKDIADVNWSGPEYPALLECAGVPFLELRPVKA